MMKLAQLVSLSHTASSLQLQASTVTYKACLACAAPVAADQASLHALAGARSARSGRTGGELL